MTTGALGDNAGGAVRPDAPVPADDFLPHPSAGMVLHRVLATSARTFLLNDLGDELPGGADRPATVDALDVAARDRPLWSLSPAGWPAGTDERHADRAERIHQSRVAMRRIRSNLRTFRLLLDPAWGTALRAELAWYGGTLGRSRDLDVLADMVTTLGPEVLDRTEMARLGAVIGWRTREVERHLAHERAGARRFHLTEQMLVLWEGPAFKAKAARPAADVLPKMLTRSWHEVRGAGRAARSSPTDANLHQLRIRLKGLRYGAETVALVEGNGARRTARAAERLQGRLGDLHDVVFATAWLEALADEQPALADAGARLVAVERDRAADIRRGWKRDLKRVERRWRHWQG